MIKNGNNFANRYTLFQINDNLSSKALVEKYRPKSVKQILGQQGEKSNAKKLYNWLKAWSYHRTSKIQPSKPGKVLNLLHYLHQTN